MKLYTSHKSRGVTILPLLKELNIEDQIEVIQVGYSEEEKNQYIKLNPLGKVPFLVDGDSVISETPAIFAYLSDKFIDRGFAPALNDPKRGEYLKWLFFCHGPLTELMDIKSLNVSAEKIAERTKSLSFGSETQVYNFIKAGLSQANPYLLGDKISAADLFLGFWLIQLISFKLVTYVDEFKPFIQLIQQRESVKELEWVHGI